MWASCCIVFVSLAASASNCFFFNATATTEIYTLSLHDALPICADGWRTAPAFGTSGRARRNESDRSEEHTSELQSHSDLVCRLLLEKKQRPLEAKQANQETTAVPVFIGRVQYISVLR